MSEERELKIGQHLIFIDSERIERDALVLAIHGDPQGRRRVARMKPNSNSYETDANGKLIFDNEPGQDWPCLNLVIVHRDSSKQDNFGRQTVKDGVTSIVHWKNSSAHGFCWRFPDELIDLPPALTIS